MTAAAAVLLCAVVLIVVTSLAIHYRNQAAAECGDWDD